MKLTTIIAMALFLGACADGSGVDTDPVVPNEVTNSDASLCQSACDMLAAGECGACTGSCDASPLSCTVYFHCILDDQNSPDTCDDEGGCEAILDPSCADWRG